MTLELYKILDTNRKRLKKMKQEMIEMGCSLGLISRVDDEIAKITNKINDLQWQVVMVIDEKVYEIIKKLTNIIERLEQENFDLLTEISQIKTIRTFQNAFDLQNFYENEEIQKANQLIRKYDKCQK